MNAFIVKSILLIRLFVWSVTSIFTSGRNVLVPWNTSIWGNEDNISIISVWFEKIQKKSILMLLEVINLDYNEALFTQATLPISFILQVSLVIRFRYVLSFWTANTEFIVKKSILARKLAFWPILLMGISKFANKKFVNNKAASCI